jgi:hypothetical protein
MELADSFQRFQPELRDMLRDAAAREEQDAQALGEVEAQRVKAASRMGEIEGLIKDAVDSGQVSKVRLPAFERGFRARVGQDVAQSLFQERLLARTKEATRTQDRVPPQQIVDETYAEVIKGIPEGDFYGRLAFDKVAQSVAAGFRQRVGEEYAANFQREAESYQSDQGSDIIYRLGTVPDDERQAVRSELRGHLDNLRAEMPKDKANAFFLERSFVPAVNELITKKKFDQADALLREVDTLDVTGQGGLLGSTSVGRTVLSKLRDNLETERTQSWNRENTMLRASTESAELRGKTDALNTVLELKKAGKWTADPADVEALISDYTKNASGSAAGLVVNTYADHLRTELKQEINARYDPFAIAPIKEQAQTYNTPQLDTAEAALEQKRRSWQISAEDYQQTKDLIRVNRAAAQIVSRESSLFDRSLITKADNFGGLNLNVPSLSPDDTKAWDTISSDPALVDAFQAKMGETFRTELRRQIEAGGNTEEVRANATVLSDKASAEARKAVPQVLRELTKKKVEASNAASVAEHVQSVRKAAAITTIAPLTLEYQTQAKRGRAGKNADVTKTYDIPKGANTKEDRSLPPAERDAVHVSFPSPFWNRLGLKGAADFEMVDLGALAKDIADNPDKAASAKASQIYGALKSRLGFTPEEITSAKTKHGVSFLPAEINPSYIPVFRTREELEKNWANGQPSDLFLKVGDAVDPNDKMKPEDFYKAQLALLSNRR